MSRGLFCRRKAAAAGLFLVAALLAGLWGCSDDAPPSDKETVTGKTPVVRPEDVHRRGPGGAAVLAPDYRQSLAADLEAPPKGKAAPPAAGAEPGAGRLFPGKPGGGTAAVPALAAPPAPVQVAANAPQAAAVAANAPTAGVVPAPTAAQMPAPPVPARQAAPAEAAAGRPEASKGFPLGACRQLILVVAPDFSSSKGVLRRFERQGPDAPWREAGQPVPCQLGRNGLGVGRGLVALPQGPVRKQGDGRTPAGFFSLPEAFGYADEAAAKAAGVRLPYHVLTDRTACVTDASSPLFGRIVGPGERAVGGTAKQERMVRDDRANVWGVVVGHNRDNPEPDAGSCVFLNTRPAGGPPTGGAVGCPEEAAAGLAAWLDPAAAPVLAVLPERLYKEGRQGWGLP
ncbi:hypothetical protein [Solidesulfovibrio sp.]|uniref:hypothetical protein n=1 Tax=Solidesulfovibrio sp. TaxID=2910990 RepID=UPI002633C797|nr:hypothetical protein [Solidesulfovibrio sp.]